MAYRDQDGDGYGVAADTVCACSLPAGYAAAPGDCDDSSAACRPGLAEACTDGLDNDCNGATDDADPACFPPRHVFVTSTSGPPVFSKWTESGGLNGAAGADAICRARAAAAGLVGDYIAWLSDDTSDAYCRLHNLPGQVANACRQPALPAAAGPWVRMDGRPFAPDVSRLVAGEIYMPPTMTEAGAKVGYSHWTGTSTRGALTPEVAGLSGSCRNWTIDTLTMDVTVGQSDGTTGAWTELHAGCATTRSLLCLERGLGAALVLTPTPGRVAFVSSVVGNADLRSWPEANGAATGLAAGDAICRTLATAAGLANAGLFVAYLSSESMAAPTALRDIGVTWVRPDGMPIAADKARLVSGQLDTSIGVTERGAYASGTVWTGTILAGQIGQTCGSWTITTGDGTIGNANLSDSLYDWADYDVAPCSSMHALYCFEP